MGIRRHVNGLIVGAFIGWNAVASGASDEAIGAKVRAITEYVIVVSIDGAKPSVIAKSKMPTLQAMARDGAVSWTAQTIYPSLTLPAHASMLTGLGPDKHLILWNDWDPPRGLVPVPTMFSLARAAGWKTMLIAAKEKFKHLELPQSLTHFEVINANAVVVAGAAAKAFAKFKPNLSFVHFLDADVAGHAEGWGSPAQKRALAKVDAGLAILREKVKASGLAGKTLFIVSADHGGHDRSHGSRRPEDMTIPWLATGIPEVRVGHSFSRTVNTVDTAATALWALGVAVPASFDGKALTEVFRVKGSAE